MLFSTMSVEAAQIGALAQTAEGIITQKIEALNLSKIIEHRKP
jgi:hypothetical protein